MCIQYYSYTPQAPMCCAMHWLRNVQACMIIFLLCIFCLLTCPRACSTASSDRLPARQQHFMQCCWPWPAIVAWLSSSTEPCTILCNKPDTYAIKKVSASKLSVLCTLILHTDIGLIGGIARQFWMVEMLYGYTSPCYANSHIQSAKQSCFMLCQHWQCVAFADGWAQKPCLPSIRIAHQILALHKCPAILQAIHACSHSPPACITINRGSKAWCNKLGTVVL